MTCCDRPADLLDLSDGALVPPFALRETTEWPWWDRDRMAEANHVVPPSRLRAAWRCASCGETRALA